MTKTMPVKAAVKNGDENEAKSVATAVTIATSLIPSTADAVTSWRSTGDVLASSQARMAIVTAQGMTTKMRAWTGARHQAIPSTVTAPSPSAVTFQGACPVSAAISLPYDIKVTGHAEAGVSFNPDTPANNINFGQTFEDQDNSIRMNQAMINVERDLDPKNADYQWGFKFTGMYGTDSRVTHFYDEFDRVTGSPYQWDIVELDAQAHLPTFGGGTDVKLGQYPTPLGSEQIDATQNTFYSHSYIFNYGLPFKHTGILTTTHVNDTLDVWLGLDTGVNNSIGQGMVNNEFPKVLAGIGLNNLMDGNLTITGLAHIGPETPQIFEPTVGAIPGAGIAYVPGANNGMREYYDLVTVYKISDAMTATNEVDVVHDDLAHATAGGMAQYLTYTINDQWSVGARAEVFADQGNKNAYGGLDGGFAGFVCDATEPLDYTNGGRGLAPYQGYCTGSGNVTYGEITLGASYKPSVTDMAYLTIRPELRYNSVVGGGNDKPFDASSTAKGTQTGQFTLAIDAIIGF